MYIILGLNVLIVSWNIIYLIGLFVLIYDISVG